MINVQKYARENIQHQLRLEMDKLAEGSGLFMLDFKDVFVYFVFVKSFNVCFYQSSDVRNFGVILY